MLTLIVRAVREFIRIRQVAHIEPVPADQIVAVQKPRCVDVTALPAGRVMIARTEEDILRSAVKGYIASIRIPCLDFASVLGIHNLVSARRKAAVMLHVFFRTVRRLLGEFILILHRPADRIADQIIARACVVALFRPDLLKRLFPGLLRLLAGFLFGRFRLLAGFLFGRFRLLAGFLCVFFGFDRFRGLNRLRLLLHRGIFFREGGYAQAAEEHERRKQQREAAPDFAVQTVCHLFLLLFFGCARISFFPQARCFDRIFAFFRRETPQ